MAITHRAFVIFTFPLCCASVGLLVTSLATHNWFQATSIYAGSNTNINYINYGLFAGTHAKSLLATSKNYDLYITCLADLNVCGWSCLGDVGAREDQIRSLYEGDDVDTSCEVTVARNLYSVPGQDKSIQQIRPLAENYFPRSQEFMNMGMWASTIAFIALSILLACVGAAFAVINTAGNPVEPILGILGLFIWNATAACSITIVLILWGIEFQNTLIDNAILPETIIGENSSVGRGALGFSYWILLGAAVLHLINIGLLFYRRYLILNAPPAPTIRMEEDPDGAIFLY